MRTRWGWACISMVAGLGFAHAAKLKSEEVDYANELPRIAPSEPMESLARFQVMEPFEMQLVAAEPLLASPVAIEWDESGGMYVCEMRGYSENRDDRLSRIAYVTDADKDGVYDRRTEFAEGLAWPTGLFPYDGGLFVADAPDLLFLKDRDGDGKADIREVVLTGFGVGNVQGLVNSFRWGLDNRIHIACSSAGGELHAPGQRDAAERINGRDIALDPRTRQWTLTSGAAQHGMCFDDWGRKFTCSNSDHLQQVMYEDHYVARNPFLRPLPSRVSIAADGPQAEVYRTSPVEPWRTLRTRLRVSGLAKGPIEGGGRAAGYFTGATGVTIYRGDDWPAIYKGQAIIGDVGGNLIHRKQLQTTGIQFVGRRIDDQRELVASTDNWFRPVQFANAPDGSLHVIDMYREVIEHPQSLPPEIKRHLDLTSGRDRGRIYRLTPRAAERRPMTDLSQVTEAEWIELLAHPNAWHRETAARLLYQRSGNGFAQTLRSWTRQTSSALGRVHGLYALAGQQSLDEETLVQCMSDSHPQVRRHAIRLAESFPQMPKVFEAMTARVDDPDEEVRYQLAFSLGALPPQQRLAPLLRILRENAHHRWIVFAALSSLDVADLSLPERLSTELQLNDQTPNTLREPVQELLQSWRASSQRTTKSSPAKLNSVPPRGPSASRRHEVVERYRPALQMPGDQERGKVLFQKHCSACHQVQGVGHEIGPNLATIRARGEEAILIAVLDPNREVNPLYLNHQVLMSDGRVTAGMISDEGANSLTLKRAKNVSETLLKVEIDDLKNTGVSLMPEEFEQALDLQAMADLIRYLMLVP